MGISLGKPTGAGQGIFQVGDCVCVKCSGVSKLVTPVYHWDFKLQKMVTTFIDSLGQDVDVTGCTVTCMDDCLTCPKASLNLSKEGVLRGTWAVGQIVDYLMTATNDGTSQLTNVTVSDAKLGLTDVPVTPGTLAPGESGTATASYTLTQADIDRGYVLNSATSNALDPDGKPVVDVSTDPTSPGPDGQTQVSGQASSGMSVVKNITSVGPYTIGSTISGTYMVTNTGNTTLTNVNVTDTNATVSGGPIATLAPGATSSVITWSKVVDQAEVDAGSHANTATGSGTNPSGAVVTGVGQQTVPVSQTNSISIAKGAVPSANPAVLGTVITYTLTVTNTGTTTVTNASVTDAKLGLTNSPTTPSTLAPGQSGTITSAYTVTAADVAAGKVDNSATGSGNGPNGQALSAGPATTSTSVGVPTLCKNAVIPDINKSGPWSVQGGTGSTSCVNLPTYAALLACLQTSSNTASSVSGIITDGPMLASTLSGFSANGTSQISANAVTTDGGAMTAVWTKTPAGTTAGSQISGSQLVFEGDNLTNSPDWNLALTNTSGRESQMRMIFTPRSSLAGTIETNYTSFEVNYDTAKYDLIITNPTNQVPGLPTGSIVPPDTNFTHSPNTSSNVSFELKPKAGVYCAPGATTNFEWKPTFVNAAGQALRNESYSANLSQLVRHQPATLTISGPNPPTSVVCGTPAVTVPLVNCP